MGWETAVSSVYSAYQNSQTLNTAESTAKAQVQQGQYQIQNLADNTVRQAGAVQTSFLQGGIAINGGPQQVLAQIFAKGNTDIQRTATNYNNEAANTVSSARSKVLNAVASQFMSSSGGTTGASNTISSGLSSATFGTNSVNGLGQSLGSGLDPSPVGPYQSPISS